LTAATSFVSVKVLDLYRMFLKHLLVIITFIVIIHLRAAASCGSLGICTL